MSKVKSTIAAVLMASALDGTISLVNADDFSQKSGTFVEYACTDSRVNEIENALLDYIQNFSRDSKEGKHSTYRDTLLEIAKIDHGNRITDFKDRFVPDKQGEYLSALNKALGECGLYLKVEISNAQGLDSVSLDLLKMMNRGPEKKPIIYSIGQGKNI